MSKTVAPHIEVFPIISGQSEGVRTTTGAVNVPYFVPYMYLETEKLVSQEVIIDDNDREAGLHQVNRRLRGERKALEGKTEAENERDATATA